MNRLAIIKELIKQKKLKNYLEIGVFNGRVFFRVSSPKKVAVDPEFIFDGTRKFGKLFANPYNIFNKYINKTSDDFFAQDAARLYRNNKIQVALVDGMHEYSFALRDVENTLKYLSDDGVIIMHDCNPQTKEAAGTFEEWRARGSGEWNGDVWKTIVHLRSMRNDINVFVLDCDHGLGIVTKRKPENMLSFTSKAEIDKLGYEDFAAHRAAWLNLKPADYIYEYMALRPGSIAVKNSL